MEPHLCGASPWPKRSTFEASSTEQVLDLSSLEGGSNLGHSHDPCSSSERTCSGSGEHVDGLNHCLQDDNPSGQALSQRSSTPTEIPSEQDLSRRSSTPTDTPSTPRPSERLYSYSTPPPVPRQKPQPLLRWALCSNSIEHARKALEEDPSAAYMPFFDHEVEPPLCCSVRHECSGDIVRLLLENRAYVDQTDVCGFTALAILSSAPSKHMYQSIDFPDALGTQAWAAATRLNACSDMQRVLDVAVSLIEARADPLNPTGANAEKDCLSCLDLALTVGNEHLVQLYLGDNERSSSGRS